MGCNVNDYIVYIYKVLEVKYIYNHRIRFNCTLEVFEYLHCLLKSLFIVYKQT